MMMTPEEKQFMMDNLKEIQELSDKKSKLMEEILEDNKRLSRLCCTQGLKILDLDDEIRNLREQIYNLKHPEGV